MRLIFGIIICQISGYVAYAETVNFTESESNLNCTTYGWQVVQVRQKWQHYSSASDSHGNGSMWENFTETLRQSVSRAIHETTLYLETGNTSSLHCSGVISVNNDTTRWERETSFQLELLDNGGSKLVGVRLIEVSDGVKNLEIYIQQALSEKQTRHRKVDMDLYYCWLDKCGIVSPDQKNFTCPKFMELPLECSYHEENIYGLDKSAGFVCKAVIPEVIVYNVYRFYTLTRYASPAGRYQTSGIIRSHVFSACADGSSVTQTRAFTISQSGSISALLISRKLGFVIAHAQKSRNLYVRWQDTEASRYNVTYSCTDDVRSSKQVRRVVTTQIEDAGFRPYLQCKVCVQGVQFEGTIISEPTCNMTRFPEEPPTQAPNITCDSDSCHIISDDKTQNITVGCSFPPKHTHNGPLTRLKVRLWDNSDSDSYKEYVFTNISTCQFNLTSLIVRETYYVAVSVCNNAGCSSFGRTTEISSMPMKALVTSQGKGFPTWAVAILVIAVVIPIIMAIGMWVFCQKKQVGGDTLPDIEEPHGYDEMDGDAGEKLTTYDLIDENPQDYNDNAVS